MPSLTEMRANPPKSRLEQSFEVVLDAELVRRVADLAITIQTLGGSRRQADRTKARQAADELEGLGPALEAASGTLVLRANLTSGEWRNFVDEHPPRIEGETGHDRDQRRTFGLVNADALIDHLGRFAHTWDGEPLATDDFDTLLRDNIAPGDLAEMATKVTLMYESSPDFAQWRSVLSTSQPRLHDSAEPETSGSPRSDSTGGSPEVSSEGSTETATPAP